MARKTTSKSRPAKAAPAVAPTSSGAHGNAPPPNGGSEADKGEHYIDRIASIIAAIIRKHFIKIALSTLGLIVGGVGTAAVTIYQNNSAIKGLQSRIADLEQRHSYFEAYFETVCNEFQNSSLALIRIGEEIKTIEVSLADRINSARNESEESQARLLVSQLGAFSTDQPKGAAQLRGLMRALQGEFDVSNVVAEIDCRFDGRAPSPN